VTATLSCLNALYLAALFWLQGDLIHASKAYDIALGAAGLFPLVGLVALAFFWRDRENEPVRAPRVPPG
jgi:hypothetical protein